MQGALILLLLLGGLMVPHVAFSITITFNDGVHGQPESYANNIVTITSLTPNSAIFGNHIILDLVEADIGRPNRFLVVDRFLDSRCQSQLSYAWWRSILNEKRLI